MNDIFLYDTHTHTNSEPLLSELKEIIDVCKQKHIVWNSIGTNVEDSLEACKQAKQYPNLIHATIGIHPSNCEDISDIGKLEEIYLQNKNVIVAIGEIGLDYKEGISDREKQKHFFIKQIELANKYDLPVCIHCRDAEEDCLEILKLVKNQSKVWIHCFSKDKKWAKIYVDKGYMFSIPGIITFKNAKDIQEAIKYIPLDRIMLETDGPYLAPVPMRGKTNLPYFVEYTLNDIAKRLNKNKEELAKIFTYNSLKLFNLIK